MANNVLYETIGRLFSRKQMRSLGGLLEASGMDFVPEAFAGVMVTVCILASIMVYVLLNVAAPLRSFVFRLSLFVAPEVVVSSQYAYSVISVVFSILLAAGSIGLFGVVVLMLMGESRKRKVEEVMPDFLSLSAANVRAGMTIDQAMWYAAKPEFGTLSAEVAIVAKRTFGGVPFNTAIDHLSERFNSKAVRRAVALIKQGIASGGKIADILERTAEDSRQMSILQKEIATSLLMYVIFIVFAGAIGTPFLFAVSGKLVIITETVFSQLPVQSSSDAAAIQGMGGPQFMPTRPQITSADFFLFTVLCATMTAIFSSLIIGVISRGSKKEGVTYMPFLIVVSLTVFLIASWLLDSLLGIGTG